MRILGVDPGLCRTGYGVIDAFGELSLIEAGYIGTNRKEGLPHRLQQIYRGIHELIKDLKPHVLVLEKVFAHYRHPMTALLMGHARGVIALAAQMENVPVHDIASTRVKKAVISCGHASKQRIQRAVQGYLRLKKPPEILDVSDALAIAIAFAMTRPAGQKKKLEELVLA